MYNIRWKVYHISSLQKLITPPQMAIIFIDFHDWAWWRYSQKMNCALCTMNSRWDEVKFISCWMVWDRWVCGHAKMLIGFNNHKERVFSHNLCKFEGRKERNYYRFECRAKFSMRSRYALSMSCCFCFCRAFVSVWIAWNLLIMHWNGKDNVRILHFSSSFGSANRNAFKIFQQTKVCDAINSHWLH